MTTTVQIEYSDPDVASLGTLIFEVEGRMMDVHARLLKTIGQLEMDIEYCNSFKISEDSTLPDLIRRRRLYRSRDVPLQTPIRKTPQVRTENYPRPPKVNHFVRKRRSAVDDKINNECFASILRNPDEPENHANPQNRALRRELRGRRRSERIERHLGLSDSSSTESDSSFSTSAAEYLVQEDRIALFSDSSSARSSPKKTKRRFSKIKQQQQHCDIVRNVLYEKPTSTQGCSSVSKDTIVECESSAPIPFDIGFEPSSSNHPATADFIKKVSPLPCNCSLVIQQLNKQIHIIREEKEKLETLNFELNEEIIHLKKGKSELPETPLDDNFGELSYKSLESKSTDEMVSEASNDRMSPEGQESESGLSEASLDTDQTLVGQECTEKGNKSEEVNLEEKYKQLETTLDLVRTEFENMEDYWQTKLQDERTFYIEQIEQDQEQLKELELIIQEYELVVRRRPHSSRHKRVDLLPTIPEVCHLELQVAEYVEEISQLNSTIRLLKCNTEEAKT